MPYIAISDGYLDQVKEKQIELVSRVTSIEANSVLCEKGEVIKDLDAIICGVYSFCFWSFLRFFWSFSYLF